ncbi:hypothetical protein C3L33_12084, partial [Rhododendron williamsianum]
MLPKENLESLIANCGFGQSSVDGGWWEWWPLGGSGKDEVVMVEEDGAKEPSSALVQTVSYCLILMLPVSSLTSIAQIIPLLSFRLATYGLAELQMEGDGNCQFRALADQLFRNPDYHKHVRKKVVKQVFPGNSCILGEWGDHITLQGAADCVSLSLDILQFEVKICLVTSFRDTCYIEILPKDKNPSRGSISYCV